MNAKQRNKNRLTAVTVKVPATVVCSNCGLVGSHFAPPSFGEPGFFTCTSKKDRETARRILAKAIKLGW